jgi:hypothetical protein
LLGSYSAVPLITKHEFRIPNARVMRRGSITANVQGFMQVGY